MNALEQAIEVLERAKDATAYSSHDDSVGYQVCCGHASYMPHDKGCYLTLAISALRREIAARV